jgi:hypothetical protein
MRHAARASLWARQWGYSETRIGFSKRHVRARSRCIMGIEGGLYLRYPQRSVCADCASSESVTFRNFASFRNDRFWRIVLQKSFASLSTNSASRRSGDRKIMWGPHHQAMNSRATSIAGLRSRQSAMAACFVFWREISRTAFWDFCNTICLMLLQSPLHHRLQIFRALRAAIGLH